MLANALKFVSNKTETKKCTNIHNLCYFSPLRLVVCLLERLPNSWPVPQTHNRMEMDPPKNLDMKRASARLNLPSNKTTPASPNQSNPAFSDQDPPKSPISVTEPVKKLKKKACPCGGSSQGQAWMMTCTQCNQAWHNTCANLKGSFPKQALDSLLKTWHCPWCWTCPFPRPGKHKSSKIEDALMTESISSAISQNIAENITDSVILPLEEKIASLEGQLKALTDEIAELKNKPAWPSSSYPLHSEFLPTPPPFEPTTITLSSEEKPVLDERNGYLPADELTSINTLLQTCKEKKLFKNKNGRSTLSYGSQYTYSGSNEKAKSSEIPPCLQKLIEKIKTDYELSDLMTPDSVLINYYPKKSNANDPASSLPSHSDDEFQIQPDSSIYTLSLGDSRPILFTAVHTDETESHVTTHNSLYVMTRASQAWYRHMMMDVEKCEERFAITLRCVKTQNKRSTLLIGDSNTKSMKFGAGKGTIGESYPGKRIKASKVKDIDPIKCAEHANIVISCGTNDLRLTEINSEDPNEYIRQLVATLKQKVEEIKLLSPKCNIILMPVLPTRDSRMNNFICKYNIDVFNSEFRKRLDITMPPLYNFLDKKNLLAQVLTREGDQIHLGNRGISLFVRTMKEAIFHCVKKGQGSYNNFGTGPLRPP